MQRNIILMPYVTKCNIKGERVAMALWRRMASQGQCVQVGPWWHWSRDSGCGGTCWWYWRGLLVDQWEAAPLWLLGTPRRDLYTDVQVSLEGCTVGTVWRLTGVIQQPLGTRRGLLEVIGGQLNKELWAPH